MENEDVDQRKRALLGRYRTGRRFEWLCWASTTAGVFLGAWGVLEWISPRSDNLWAAQVGFFSICTFAICGVDIRRELARLKREIDAERFDS
jgi:hypothetical protein